MYSMSARFNQIVFFTSCVLASAAVLNQLTAYVMTTGVPVIDIEITQIDKFEHNTKGLYGGAKADWDQINFKFDLKADLQPLFNWNLKQLFLYINVHFTDPQTGFTSDNIVYDRIITRPQNVSQTKDVAVLNLKGQRIEYPLRDVYKKFRGQLVSLEIWVEVMPVVGVIYKKTLRRTLSIAFSVLMNEVYKIIKMINQCWNIPTLPTAEYTTVFVQAHYLLIIRLQYLTLYSFIKLALSLTGLFLSSVKGCLEDPIYFWALLFSILQMFNIQYHQMQKKHLDDIQKTQLIAVSLGQMHDNQEQLQNIPRAQIEKMIQSIKSSISTMDQRINTQARFLIFASQLLVIKYIYTISTSKYEINRNRLFLYHGNCNDILLNISFIHFLLLIVEYLVLYLFVTILLLSLPFLSLYLFFKKLAKSLRLYRLRKRLDSFTQHAYLGKEDEWVLQDHECRICMMDYEEGQQLMQLPCNSLHHFHSTCIKEWLKVDIIIYISFRFQSSVHSVERSQLIFKILNFKNFN